MFAVALFSHTQTTITRATHNDKLIWDKHYTGQNQAKGIANLEERRQASKCPLCDSVDAKHHWIRECAGLAAGERANCRAALQQAISAQRDKRNYDSETIMDIAETLAFEHKIGADIWISIRSCYFVLLLHNMHSYPPTPNTAHHHPTSDVAQGIWEDPKGDPILLYHPILLHTYNCDKCCFRSNSHLHSIGL